MQKAKKPIARWAFLLFIGAADRNRTGDLRITNAHVKILVATDYITFIII